MEIPYARWYSAVPLRRSRRRFDAGRPVEPAALAALERVCLEFRPFSQARSVLVNNPSIDIFKGILGSYGKIVNAPAFLALIGNTQDPFVQEKTGYTGEGIILEATALGLNTCWVGGFFNPRSVSSLIEIKTGERILAVSPLGHTLENESLQEIMLTGFGRTHKRNPVTTLILNGNDTKLADWVSASLEASRLAPSAINRQPWGFDIQDDGVTVFVRTVGPEFGISKRLDCGITMLHLETAAGHFGIKGNWQFLEAPLVAKFTIQPNK
jgi:hypothetical protein